MDCRIGKTLNPKTCVYVKDCKPGFSRNARFVCRKTKTKTKTNMKSKMNLDYKKTVLNRTKKLMEQRMEKRIMEKRIMEKRMENQLEQDKRVANARQAKLNGLKTKLRLNPVSKKNPTPRIKVRT